MSCEDIAIAFDVSVVVTDVFPKSIEIRLYFFEIKIRRLPKLVAKGDASASLELKS